MRELTLNEIAAVVGGLPQSPVAPASQAQPQMPKDCGLSAAEVEAACVPLMLGAALAGGTVGAAAAAAVTVNPFVAAEGFSIGSGAAELVVGNLCHEYMFNHCRL